MCETSAIKISDVGKMFKIFPNKFESLRDALNDSFGICRWLPLRKALYQEFWALRGISLDLKAGSRIGIIGRNGAGKSTLLKLITGNYNPTEGTIAVNGKIQALLESGAGFHPEFTGYENIKASLIYQGLSNVEIEEAIVDIASFTELGNFLQQPFKTYSMGMQARLTFATATAINPNILIVDEVLGAGDAYFFGKSQERMQNLVEKSGASVLLVSHALDQITRFCNEAIWIERGKVVKRGSPFEVVDSYVAFTQVLEERRLKAKNMKVRSNKYSYDHMHLYTDSLTVNFEITGSAGAVCDVKEISLIHDGDVEDRIAVGDAQDANPYQTGCLTLGGSDWSTPMIDKDSCWRGLKIDKGQQKASGLALFHSYGFFSGLYTLKVCYRCKGNPSMIISLKKNGVDILQNCTLSADGEDWIDAIISIPGLGLKSVEASSDQIQNGDSSNAAKSFGKADNESRSLIHWTGEGSLIIDNVRILGDAGAEKTIFRVGNSLTLELSITAKRNGHYQLLPTATLYRQDGVFVSNFIGDIHVFDMSDGQQVTCNLILDELNLGDGYYTFSVAIFENIVSESSRYDLISRGYEFQVVGNESLHSAFVFQHISHWTFSGGDISTSRTGFHN
jgi:lipopolysaccharide transport system ATP-binding protein